MRNQRHISILELLLMKFHFGECKSVKEFTRLKTEKNETLFQFDDDSHVKPFSIVQVHRVIVKYHNNKRNWCKLNIVSFYICLHIISTTTLDHFKKTLMVLSVFVSDCVSRTSFQVHRKILFDFTLVSFFVVFHKLLTPHIISFKRWWKASIFFFILFALNRQLVPELNL